MALSDVKCRKTRCPDDKKQIKITDAHGLYLLITDRGGRYWRWNYRWQGKQRTLAIGVYPDVTLAEAREARDQARAMLRDGRDPGRERGRKRGNRFRDVAGEWMDMRRHDLADSTVRLIEMRLVNDILPHIGDIPVADVRASDVLAMLQAVCERGAVETAHRCRSIVGQVLRYAIVTGRAESDPTPALKGAIRRPDTKSMATMLEPDAIGAMLRGIDAYGGSMVVRCALMLNILTFVRPSELRLARWDEFDLDAAEWRVPAARMKMKNRGDHIVPLADQAVDLLRELQAVTGYSDLVFPSPWGTNKPISTNTLNHALRRMGISKNRQVVHGFRAMARTLLAEQGWNPEFIERQLAHVEQSRVVAAYNRAEHLPERRRMMQAWADYLDAVKSGK